MLCGGEKATPFTDVSSGYVNQILWPIFDVISYLKWDHVKKNVHSVLLLFTVIPCKKRLKAIQEMLAQDHFVFLALVFKEKKNAETLFILHSAQAFRNSHF